MTVHRRIFLSGLVLAMLVWTGLASAVGLSWPTNIFLPAFSTPASSIDCIDISSSSGAEQDLFASLEGIVNRTQPRIACVSSSAEEGEFTWLTVHNLPHTLINGYSAISKYQTNVTGLVVTDASQPDTLNLATTIAGLNNELICDPALLATLTNAPYHLTIKDDLRGRFSGKYAVYQYLYTNCWPQCTHRIITGMETNGHGALRDYIVAVKSAAVWLDPGVAADASALTPFLSNMTPLGGVYLGWWPSEDNGLQWIAKYGIPVVASDWYNNGTLFGGVTTPVSIPTIPPAPPLQNKIYVAVTLSDGDNMQYMQHHLRVNWGNAARGKVPIGWTAQPMAVDMDPGMLNYYWSTATTNDCLMAGPSGAGYARINYWSAANLAAYTKASNPYMQRSGMRTITVWLNISSATANSFATNCPTMIGLYDQNGGVYATSYKNLPVIGLPGNDNYTSSEPLLYSGITNATANWSGTAPMFLSVEGSGWSISPSDCQTLANALDKNKYVMVRPDHLFLLYRQAAGLGTNAATPYVATQPVGQLAPVGTNITFSALATGSAPLSYHWRFNGTNITGATNSSYMKANVQPSDAGNYSVVVTNVAGTAISSNAVLAFSTFTTNAPYAFTRPAATVNPTAVSLDGFAVGNGGSSIAWFDWGTNTSYGQQTVGTHIGNGYQVVPVAAGLNGLTIGQIYHYRLSASNSLGVARGYDQIFTTGSRVKPWGDNSYGQTNVPPGLTSVASIASGGYHGLALNTDGSVSAWGFDIFGQAEVPPNLTNVVALAAGFYHNLALKSDGTVTGWGGNNFGQLNLPAGLTAVAAVGAGGYHSLALKADGSVICWGNNNNGQTNVPSGLANVVAIAGGLYFSAALKVDGTVAAWGDNTYGQTSVPAGLSNVVAISSGAYHCLALKADGTVAVWGRNNLGQTNLPPNLNNVAAIACGDYFNLALKTNGAIVAWGDDGSGQTDLPSGLTNVVQLSCGVNHAMAIGDLAPQAHAQIASGYVNHDLVIALSGTLGDGPVLNFRVATLPETGMLYQFSAGSRGSSITLASPDVGDASGRIIFAPVTNGIGSPYDNFNFVANDGLNDSAPASVIVNLGLPAAPQFNNPAGSGGVGESFSLLFRGSSNASYSVWASTNLLDWLWLGTAGENTPGQYGFTDESATNWPARFYRISAP